MATLAEFRSQHPEYNDMNDGALLSALHTKFYSDLPKQDFINKMLPDPRTPEAPEGNVLLGTGEAVLSQATAVPAMIAGIGSGIAAIPTEGFAGYRPAQRATAEKYTYQPESQTGQKINAAIGAAFSPMTRAFTAPERFAEQIPEQYGGKAIAGAIGLGTDLGLTLVPGLKGGRALIGGPKAIAGAKTVGGVPTLPTPEVTPQMRGTAAAKDVVEQASGIPSKSAAMSGLKSGVKDMAKRAKDEVDAAFATVRAKMPESTPALSNNLRDLLQKESIDAGGPDKLSAPYKAIYTKLGEDVPTYGRLDDLRQEIGAKDTSAQNPYGNLNSGQRDQIYKALRADQEATADLHGVKADLTRAWDLTKQQKMLQEANKELFGKNLKKSGARHVKASANGLLENDPVPFDNFIDNVPDQYQASARASVLNEMLIPGKERLLTPKFGKSWQAMTPEAKSRLLKDMPPETEAQLDSIAQFSQDMTLPEQMGLMKQTVEIAKQHPIALASVLTGVTGGLFGLGPVAAISAIAGLYEATKFMKARRVAKAVESRAQSLQDKK